MSGTERHRLDYPAAWYETLKGSSGSYPSHSFIQARRTPLEINLVSLISGLRSFLILFIHTASLYDLSGERFLIQTHPQTTHFDLASDIFSIFSCAFSDEHEDGTNLDCTTRFPFDAMQALKCLQILSLTDLSLELLLRKIHLEPTSLEHTGLTSSDRACVGDDIQSARKCSAKRHTI